METTPETTPVTPERRRAQSLLDGQRRVLRLINEDKPLHETLEAICRLIEAQGEGMLCSVLLMDEEGEHLLHGAAPSLPADYSEAIDGITIGPGVGSCGTAAHSAEPCVVEDIATHPSWAAFRDLAYVKHGLRACWSTPIRSYEGKVMATFAMYYRIPKLPTLHERKLIDFTSHLVTIAVNRHHERQMLDSMD